MKISDQVLKDTNLDDEYNMVFGNKSKTMPGNSRQAKSERIIGNSISGMSASFYPGFEYEKPPSKPATENDGRY